MDDAVICTRTQKKTLTRCMSVSIRQPSLVTMQLHKLCPVRQVSRLSACALHGDGIARASHPSSLLCLRSRCKILSHFRLLRRPPDVFICNSGRLYSKAQITATKWKIMSHIISGSSALHSIHHILQSSLRYGLKSFPGIKALMRSDHHIRK